MVKDDSLYVIAIVAVVAVVGLVIMATGSDTVVVAEELPGMAEDSSAAIAGQAFRTGPIQKAVISNTNRAGPSYKKSLGTESIRETSNTDDSACEEVSYYADNDGDGLAAVTATAIDTACVDEISDMSNVATSRTDCDDSDSEYGDWLDARYCRDFIGADGYIDVKDGVPIDCKTGAELLDDNLVLESDINNLLEIWGSDYGDLISYGPYGVDISSHQGLTEAGYIELVRSQGCQDAIMVYKYNGIYDRIYTYAFYYRAGSVYGY